MYYDTEALVVCQTFQTDPENGLNSAEISSRIEKYVENILSKTEHGYLLIEIGMGSINYPLLQSRLY